MTGASLVELAAEVGTDAPGVVSEGSEPSRGLLSWYRDGPDGQKRTFWICYACHVFDAMDVQFYSFAIPPIMATLALTHGQAGDIASVALITSSVGGWCAGILADRIGRVRTLQIMITWFALFSFLSGLAHSYGQLLFTRSLLGLGFGGETAISAILMAETVVPLARGRAVGLVQSGWSVGSIAAALGATVIFSLLPAAIGWRVLFAIGLLPALLVLIIQRKAEEPQIFLRSQASRAAPANPLSIFSAAHIRTTIAATAVGAGILGGNLSLSIWLPTFLRSTRKLSVFGTGSYLSVVYLGALAGYFTGSYLADRIGRKRNFMIFTLGAVAALEIYTEVPINDPEMLILGFPLGFFSSGVLAGVGSFLSELFPTEIRGSGQAFAFNGVRAIAAMFPALIGIAGNAVPLGLAVGLIGLLPWLMLICTLLLLPETKGRRLDAVQPGAELSDRGSP